MLPPGMRVPLQDIPARRGWAKEDSSEMGRCILSLASWDIIGRSGDGQVPVVTADAQPARPKLHVTCGRFPTAAGEQSSPSPTGRGVRPQNPPSRGLRERTGVQPEHLTHSPHVPSQ